MAFFDALRRGWGAQDDRGAAPEDRRRLAEAWGLSDTSHPEFPRGAPVADPAEMAAPVAASAYDREQWLRKLKRILDKLPSSQGEWDPMLAEARALGFDDEWIHRAMRNEFNLLLRRAVADHELTVQEHRKIDLARDLIGIPEPEAVAMLNAIIAEAEAFFGRAVEGERPLAHG